MNGLFVFTIILALATLVALALGGVLVAASKGPEGDEDLMAGGIVSLVIGGFLALGTALALIFSSFNSVGTYDIGVTTSFGKVLSYVGPGAHWIAPWENMSLMDESVQSLDYGAKVRLAQQQTAQATVHLRVRVQPGATDALFKLYKGNTANVMTGLVEPKLNEAMNTVLGGYNPITPLSTHAPEGTAGNPTTAQFSDEITSVLNHEIGSQVQIISLVLKPLNYDPEVDNRINSVISQTAKTDTAQEAIKTAQAQAQANKIAKTALSNNPLVLVQQCMTAIADGQLNPPVGFSCWPGGSSSNILLPGGK